MKRTIEERAKESIHKYYNCNGEYTCERISDCEMCDGTNTPYDCCECAAEDYMQGYIQGATDQHKTDIEKACEWLNANWRKYIDTDADGMIRFSGWKNDFKKEMED